MNSRKLRKDTLIQRDMLSALEQRNKGMAIMRRLLHATWFDSANTIFTYVDFRSEVATRPLIEHILDCGKTALVPVTLVKEKDLLAVSISNLDSELAPGYCSIPEPIQEIRDKQMFAPENIDIIFLPGSVFDEQGGRMGYGGGYYDRFVSQKAPQALRVGLAYEMQVVKRAPLQVHDELLDYIITEKRIITGSR